MKNAACKLNFTGCFLLEGDDNLSGNFEGIKQQKFGVEVECTG